MNVVGIIAEYNPFHNGHLYQIQQAREETNADYVVVILSGNYVQRGTPAIADKYTRTKMALSCGADLVFELPTVYATASAECFAFGGVSLLHSLGFVTHLCFGCETPNPELFLLLANLYTTEPACYKEQLLSYIKNGLSFPKARYQATIDYFKEQKNTSFSLKEIEHVLNQPNNILAIEYTKALQALGSSIKPVPIQRKQSGYHEKNLTNPISSATGIRTEYEQNQDFQTIEKHIPSTALSYLKQANKKTFPVVADDFSSLLYYKLLHTTKHEGYSEVSSHLFQRIKKKLSMDLSYTQFASELKSKDYVYTRICRGLLQILLELKHTDPKKRPPYLRLLGLNKAASHLISSKKDTDFHPLVPVITKVADAKSILSDVDYEIFQIDLTSSQIYYHICHQKFGSMPKSEYQQGPVIM